MSALDLFWFLAGLLTAVAAGLVFAPLLPRSAATGDRLRAAKWPLILAAPAIALGLGLYLWHGRPDQTLFARATPAVQAAAAPNVAKQRAGSMDMMLTRLEERLAKQGGKDADWELLAQTYGFLGRKADAANARTLHQLAAGSASTTDSTWKGAAVMAAGLAAPTTSASEPQQQTQLARAESARQAHDYRSAASLYEQLAARGAMTAQSWADYADVSASLNGNKLTGAPERYVDSALAIDPNNEKAMWLKASAEHEGKRYSEAVLRWRALLRLIPADSADAKIFAANMTEDEALAGNAGAVASAPVIAPAQIDGEVELADTLKDRVPAGLTLFVVAKALDSPGAPVAVVRTQTGRWPLKFLLDDSLAMLPARNLSSAARVTVEARVSHSGLASVQSGDFQSATATVDPRAHKAVRLVIDHVIG